MSYLGFQPLYVGKNKKEGKKQKLILGKLYLTGQVDIYITEFMLTSFIQLYFLYIVGEKYYRNQEMLVCYTYFPTVLGLELRTAYVSQALYQ